MGSRPGIALDPTTSVEAIRVAWLLVAGRPLLQLFSKPEPQNLVPGKLGLVLVLIGFPGNLTDIIQSDFALQPSCLYYITTHY